MPATYPVPRAIRDVAKRAIAQNLSLPMSQRAAFKGKGKQRKPWTGMRTARKLVSGRVDKEQLILMRAWFARHGESPGEKDARKDKTSKASIAWRLWGGSGSIPWINQTLRMIEKKKQRSK